MTKSLKFKTEKEGDQVTFSAFFGDKLLLSEKYAVSNLNAKADFASRLHEEAPGLDQPEIMRSLGTVKNQSKGVATPIRSSGGDYEPDLARMDEVSPSRVNWAWKDRLAYGRLSLLVGPPGCGKSYLVLDMASRITTGRDWPDGSPCEQGDVILMTNEDDASDTIRPRLDALGAAVERVFHFRGMKKKDDATGEMLESSVMLANTDVIEKALIEHPNCKMLLVDPIGSFLGGKVDAHRDNEVRGALTPIVKLAEKYNVLLFVTCHTRKSVLGSADEQTLGSTGFVGLARAVFHLFEDHENRGRRILLPGKNNLANPSGLAFRIKGDPAVLEWDDNPVELSADEYLQQQRAARHKRKPSKLDEACDWLKEFIGEKELLASDVKEKGELAGHSSRTIERASKRLGVVRRTADFGGKHFWSLPGSEDGSFANSNRDAGGGTVGETGDNLASLEKGTADCFPV